MQVDGDGLLSLTQVEMTVEELKTIQRNMRLKQQKADAEHEAAIAAEREAESMIDDARDTYFELFGRYPGDPI